MVGKISDPLHFSQNDKSMSSAAVSVLLSPAVVAPATEYRGGCEAGELLKIKVTKTSSRVCLVVVGQAASPMDTMYLHTYLGTYLPM